LYRNNGNGTFTNISKEAGILKEGFGLGVAIFDANKDDAPDIYVGNDYLTNDLLYVNDGQGQFIDKIDEAIMHQSRFSMGNDAADINNDGHLDIMTLDMLPESNLRKKTVIVGNGYIVYINDNRYGYTHQYVRNMLQLNNGNMNFSEIGQLAGVHQTEWSWSPLFADIDNDGFKDLLITNGFPKDITDNDFISFRKQAGAFTSLEQLLEQIPSVKIPNYAFRNEGNLKFTDVSATWGFTQSSFSNGAAFADLDNDGDLDYIVNNINDPAFLYENTISDREKDPKHFLRIHLKGPTSNPTALGAKVSIEYADGMTQYHEQNLYRGYVSTVEEYVHFGLGSHTLVDKLSITWPDGKETQMEGIQADQVLELKHSDAKEREKTDMKTTEKTFVEDITASIDMNYVHEEADFIDYNIQRNIPHKFSQYGPAIAVGDVNGDQLDDFITGGSRGYAYQVFIQNKEGKFNTKSSVYDPNRQEEDRGILLFDADTDGDLDLYLVSGSLEHPEGSEPMQDRLLLNDGNGNFRQTVDALPQVRASGSCVRAADYDADGDLDLFVGGRVVVGAYPGAPRSYILNNEGGKFTDVTQSVSPELLSLGMVTDAIWSDFNDDGTVDLIVVGEFMPISFFSNKNGNLHLETESGISQFTGWWNSIIAGDFDKDGDMDYVAGNVGENNFYCATPEQPVRITAKDFDNNGALDAVMSCYLKAEDGTMKAFPIHSWAELNAQSPVFRARFKKYEEYGRTTIDSLFTPTQLQGALVLEANHLSSSYIENLGQGKFKMHKLSLEAQFAPINGMLSMDLNQDQHLDIIMIGNDYGNEVNMGQYDAFRGLVLLGNGNGGFSPLPNAVSGFLVGGDAKALSRLHSASGQEYLLASQNRGPLKVFAASAMNDEIFVPEPLDFSAKIFYKDGTTEKIELGYGSGFLSQSGRKISLPAQVSKLEVTDYTGKLRELSFPEQK